MRSLETWEHECKKQFVHFIRSILLLHFAPWTVKNISNDPESGISLPCLFLNSVHFMKKLLKMAPIWKKVGDQYEKTSNTFPQKLLLVTFSGWNRPGVQILLVNMEQTIFWEKVYKKTIIIGEQAMLTNSGMIVLFKCFSHKISEKRFLAKTVQMS